jgi:hypothetical protein
MSRRIDSRRRAWLRSFSQSFDLVLPAISHRKTMSRMTMSHPSPKVDAQMIGRDMSSRLAAGVSTLDQAVSDAGSWR